MRKIKTPASEFTRLTCVEPSRRAKNEAIRNNRPFDAISAAISETTCRLREESFKQNKPKRRQNSL